MYSLMQLTRSEQSMFQAIHNSCGSLATLIGREIYYKQKSSYRYKKYGFEHEERRWISEKREYFAEKFNRSLRSIDRALKKLKELGFILVRSFWEKFHRHTNCFTWLKDPLAPSSQSGEEERQETPESPEIKAARGIQRNSIATFLSLSISTLKNNLNSIFISETKDNKMDSHTLPSFTALHMVNLYNQVLKEKRPAEQDDPELHAPLHFVFQKHFLGDMKRVEYYLIKIAMDPYLSGEKFQVTLKKAFTPRIIELIQTGALKAFPSWGEEELKYKTQIPETKADTSQSFEERKPDPHVIADLTECNESKDFRKDILELIGPSCYKSWFEDAIPVMLNGRWKMTTSSPFVQYSWKSRSEFEELRRRGWV